MDNRGSLGLEKESGADLFSINRLQSNIRSAMDQYIKEKEKELKSIDVDSDKRQKIKDNIEAMKFSSRKGSYLPKDLQAASFFWMPVCIGYQAPPFSKRQYLELLKAAKNEYKHAPSHVGMKLYPNQHHQGLNKKDSIFKSIELWNQEEPTEVHLLSDGSVNIQEGSEFADLASCIEGVWKSPPEGYESIKAQLQTLLLSNEKKSDALKENFIERFKKDLEKNQDRFSHISEGDRSDHFIGESADLIARMPVKTKIKVDESGEWSGLHKPKIVIAYHADSKILELMKYSIEKASIFDRESCLMKSVVFFGFQELKNKKLKSTNVSQDLNGLSSQGLQSVSGVVTIANRELSNTAEGQLQSSLSSNSSAPITASHVNTPMSGISHSSSSVGLSIPGGGMLPQFSFFSSVPMQPASELDEQQKRLVGSLSLLFTQTLFQLQLVPPKDNQNEVLIKGLDLLSGKIVDALRQDANARPLNNKV